MNILICSVGRRVKLVEYFKQELGALGGQVIAVDCNPTASALYFADQYEIVPRIDNPEYIQVIKSLCHKYEIDGILSLIDPELTLLAEYRDEFKDENVHIIVSDKRVVEICYDKYLTYNFLKEHYIPAVKTYVDIVKVIGDINEGKLTFPLMVKPKNGSASLGISKILSIRELELLQNETKEFVIQPFITGEEFGVDCYIDLLSYKPTNIFIKKKIAMRAGETDKSISVKDMELTQMVEKLISVLKPIGPIDIDCFMTEKGYIISEVNPRFGGGYLHAHEMGQNFVRNIITNLQGEVVHYNTSDYDEGITMIRYDQLIIK